MGFLPFTRGTHLLFQKDTYAIGPVGPTGRAARRGGRVAGPQTASHSPRAAPGDGREVASGAATKRAEGQAAGSEGGHPAEARGGRKGGRAGDRRRVGV